MIAKEAKNLVLTVKDFKVLNPSSHFPSFEEANPKAA
jgi:hypothetical protein